MDMSPAGSSYVPSARAIEIVQERLQRMGFMLSEPAARSMLEAVLAVEIPRFEIQTRGTAQSALEQIRQTAQAALLALARPPAEPVVAAAPRPMLPPSDAREAVRARVPVDPDLAARQPRPPEPPRVDPRPVSPRRPNDEPQEPPRPEPRARPRPDDDEPRPVFKRPRGR